MPTAIIVTPPTPRPSWDAFFMGIAKAASSRATCTRAKVGAVIVRNNKALGFGYNGAIRGLEHCDQGEGCMLEGLPGEEHCSKAVHAEANAIIQAGRDCEGATLYCTHFPCWPCFKLCANAGIVRIVYGQAYRIDQRVIAYAGNVVLQAAVVPAQCCDHKCPCHIAEPHDCPWDAESPEPESNTREDNLDFNDD